MNSKKNELTLLCALVAVGMFVCGQVYGMLDELPSAEAGTTLMEGQQTHASPGKRVYPSHGISRGLKKPRPMPGVARRFFSMFDVLFHAAPDITSEATDGIVFSLEQRVQSWIYQQFFALSPALARQEVVRFHGVVCHLRTFFNQQALREPAQGERLLSLGRGISLYCRDAGMLREVCMLMELVAQQAMVGHGYDAASTPLAHFIDMMCVVFLLTHREDYVPVAEQGILDTPQGRAARERVAVLYPGLDEKWSFLLQTS